MKHLYYYIFLLFNLVVLPIFFIADKLDAFMEWYIDATGIENE